MEILTPPLCFSPVNTLKRDIPKIMVALYGEHKMEISKAPF
jgi:hypothetical protein